MNVYRKTEADSKIYKTHDWLPVGREKGKGVRWGMELGHTNYCI